MKWSHRRSLAIIGVVTLTGWFFLFLLAYGVSRWLGSGSQ